MSAYSRVIAAAANRLAFHAANQPGRLLRMVKYEPNPVKEIQGRSDLPNIRLFGAKASEKFVARQASESSAGLRVQVSIDRSTGTQALALALVERVMDALEIAEDGAIDPVLDGTIEQPFSWTANEGNATELTFTIDAVITFQPATHALRGQRRVLRVMVDAAGRPLMFDDGQLWGPAGVVPPSESGPLTGSPGQFFGPEGAIQGPEGDLFL